MVNIDFQVLKKSVFLRQVQKDRFSLRIKIIGGQITGKQLAKINEIADKYGKGYIHLTSRQGIEIPHIRLADIETVITELARADVALGTCGPRVRTITACQGKNVCPCGLIDTTGLAQSLDEKVGGRELPHKFKIGITGCHNNCLKAEENDLGFKGGLQPVWAAKECSYCGLCEAICPSEAIQVDKVGRNMEFLQNNCIYCGRCVKNCPAESWTGKQGYLIYFGGLFGKRIVSAKQLVPIVFGKTELFSIVEKTFAFFSTHGQPGERFRSTVERVGWDLLTKELAKK